MGMRILLAIVGLLYLYLAVWCSHFPLELPIWSGFSAALERGSPSSSAG